MAEPLVTDESWEAAEPLLPEACRLHRAFFAIRGARSFAGATFSGLPGASSRDKTKGGKEDLCSRPLKQSFRGSGSNKELCYG